MFEAYIHELEQSITQKENLKLIRSLSQDFVRDHSLAECWIFSRETWGSPFFQVQELGVFICGHIGNQHEEALAFLENEVVRHPDWRVQEVLAMAFDICCSHIGYEQALPLIQKWLSSDNEKQRRAAAEGLRVWTSRRYFRENPLVAIKLLAGLRGDESAYVRKSAGNALRDISKKFPELVSAELNSWDLSDKKIAQVCQSAGRYLSTAP